jgi:tetratricopeptide (TPR) repeat protein
MDPREPAPIPDHAWDHTSIVKALRDRDAAALVLLARKYGASQYYLSGRAMYITNGTLTQNQLSLIANGKTKVEKLEVWERLAAAMDMPDRARVLLGLAPLSRKPATSAPSTGAGNALETMRQDLLASLQSYDDTGSTVEDWEQTALLYGRATRNTPPAILLKDLTADFFELSGCLKKRQSARQQRRLCYVTAQFAGLVSLLLTNVDQYAAARSWGRLARLAADDAADPCLASWVRAQDAYALFYEGRNYRAAIDIAQHAQHISDGRQCAGVALAAALEARASAIIGDTTQTVAAIARAEDALSALDTDSQPSAFGYNEAQLRFHEGNAFTHLQLTDRAWKAQGRALELYPASDTLDRTLVHLDHATTLAATGETDEAATYATTKLLELQPHQRTDLIMIRARHLLNTLKDRPTSPAVQELHALIIEATTDHQTPQGNP